MMALGLKLLLAHLLGDFVFQSKKWVDDKVAKKHKSKYLYIHLGVHAVLLLVFLNFQSNYFWAIGIILISHFSIDLLKIYLTKYVNHLYLFLADQFLHLLVLALVVGFYYPYRLSFEALFSSHHLLLIVALIFLSFVSAIIMKHVMSGFKFEENLSDDSLKNAGKIIGILERLFVFGFIVLGQWQVIGFLLAAKSVFRFGDLSRAKDRKLTEYILIGTLISFGLAILVGLIYLKLSEVMVT